MILLNQRTNKHNLFVSLSCPCSCHFIWFLALLRNLVLNLFDFFFLNSVYGNFRLSFESKSLLCIQLYNGSVFIRVKRKPVPRVKGQWNLPVTMNRLEGRCIMSIDVFDCPVKCRSEWRMCVDFMQINAWFQFPKLFKWYKELGISESHFPIVPWISSILFLQMQLNVNQPSKALFRAFLSKSKVKHANLCPSFYSLVFFAFSRQLHDASMDSHIYLFFFW